ncbi:hypothetical protein [Nocardia nova]|uniref:hypothetical protein n=1 Tax=Nocardia nova TaxID=37330 RepID=UPI0033C7E234
MQLEQITAELYALDPAHFVSARDERVRAARADGDKALATAISRLRRPTVAAWAVNLLARNETQELGALLDLGEALSRAQRTLAAEQMRTLAGQRRSAVNALTHKAARLAAESGKTLTDPVRQDITRTLNAALAEPELAQQVRAGVVTTAAEYAGFGPAGPELAAVPDAGETIETPGDDDLTGSERDVESARAVRDSARDEVERRRAEVADLAERVTSARAELDRAEEAQRFAATGLASAETAMERADAELERAETELARRRGHRS